MVDKTTLKNGLRILTIPQKQANTITVMVTVNAGSRFETPKTNGLSHFLEHMFFKGTKARPTAFDISKIIDGIGGEINAATGKDQTLYYVKTTPKHTEIALDVLSDMLLNSKFEASEINREKGVITEEINMYEDTPIKRVGDIFDELLYGNQPLGWSIIGSKENIKNMTRADFTDYVDSLYLPANIIVAFAGATNSKNTTKLVNKFFAKIASKKPKTRQLATKDTQCQPDVKVYYKKTDQAHMILGARSYNLFHIDRYVVSVLGAILGGGMSSRLFIEVRERRGLAYYVKSETELYQDVGSFITQAGVDLRRIELAIKVICQEYEKIKDKISSEELNRAKEYLKGKLLLSLEDTHTLASFYASTWLLEDKIRTPEDIIAEIDRVTKQDIFRVARDIFTPDKLNLAIIGPFKDKEKFEKLLRA